MRLDSDVRYSMKPSVTSVDHAPEELYEETPFIVKVVRQIPGPDRPYYWLGELGRPLKWIVENIEREVSHLIIASRRAGAQIEPHVENLPVGLACLADAIQLDEPSVDFGKSRCVAIGAAAEIEGANKPEPLARILAGNIARAFGVGGARRDEIRTWQRVKLRS